jgi:hypothetical protein
MTDGRRAADEDNPQGYYEWEPIKQLPDDPHIIAEAAGRAVKVVSPLLPFLAKKHRYRILFLRRDLEQMIRSQDRMRHRLAGALPGDSPAALDQIHEHLDETYRLLNSAPNIEWIEIDYEKLIEKSDAEFVRIANFCGLGTERVGTMKSVVKEIHRQGCSADLPSGT